MLAHLSGPVAASYPHAGAEATVVVVDGLAALDCGGDAVLDEPP